MQGLFRVFLNGVFVNDEPIGLSTTELTITRDEKLKGVFFSFITDIVFWGDGYTALKVIRDSAAGCSQVSCNIEYQCAETNGYEVLFEGVIPLGAEEIEWDDYNCKVTCTIENADFSNFLQTYGDYELPVNREFCIDGTTALASITTNFTEFFPSFTGTLTGTSVQTYLFTDALQQSLSYLSNNAITLDADTLYSTLFDAQVLQITFIDAIVSGDIVTIDWTNYFGQQYQAVFGFGAGLLQDQINSMLSQLLHFINFNITPDEVNRENYFEKASWVEIGALDPEIWNYLPWQSYTITYTDNIGNPKNATLVETQAFDYGLKNLAVTSSTLIQGQQSTLTTTLNKLLQHANEFHNMGFQIIKTTTGYDFKLRTLESQINNTDTAIVLPQVSAITSKASTAYNVATLTTAQGKSDNIFKPLSFDVRPECYGDQEKIEGDNYSTQEIFDLLTSQQIQDDELVYVFLKEGDLTEVEKYKFRLGKAVIAQPGFSNEFFHYNIPYIYGLLPVQYFINGADNDFRTQIPFSTFDVFASCSNCPDAVITNTNTKKLLYEYTFEYPLSYSQVRTLIDNSTNYITFSDARNITKQGFIKEVTIPFQSFICSFSVYSD